MKQEESEDSAVAVSQDNFNLVAHSIQTHGGPKKHVRPTCTHLHTTFGSDERIYRYTSHTPLGRVFFFQARLLDNQGGANAERRVFGKLSARRFQRRLVFATDGTPTVEISTIEIGRGGAGVVYKVVYGT